MVYGLRKIRMDRTHHNFEWALEVGATVECPDWDPKPECGHGLHLLPNAQGDWDLLDGHYWVVIEYDFADLVMIGEDKGKVPRCKIIEIQEPDNLDPDKLLSYFDVSKFNSETAFEWARNIGNQNIMIDKIVDSYWAYRWASHIGNRDVMIDRATSSQAAYYWACNFGDRDIMIDRVTEPDWAYSWVRQFGNRDIMIDRITDSFNAYLWARDIGDENIMIDRVIGSRYAYYWAIDLGDYNVMKSRVTEPYWIERWNERFPDNQIEAN